MQDAAALLIIGIVLGPLGGDRPVAVRHIAELQLPDRQHAQAVVAEDADIDFAALDVLLGDGGGADPFMDEADALGELVVGIDDGGLRDAVGAVLDQTLDDQRQRQTRRTLDLAALRKHGEGGSGMR